jgi:hypothetical protein
MFDKKCLHDYKTNGPRSSEIFFRDTPFFLWGYSKHIQQIQSAEIFRILFKFCMYVKEHYPIWALKGFFILIREKVVEF